MQTGQVTKSRSKPRNVLLGIIPTATTFTTPPSNLENCTDGDPSTVTGTGTKTGSGVLGNLTFDLGSVKDVLITTKQGIWSDSGTIYLFINTSNDGVTYTGISASTAIAGWTATSEFIKTHPMYWVKGRYIRLTYETSGNITGNVKLYEVKGWELG